MRCPRDLRRLDQPMLFHPRPIVPQHLARKAMLYVRQTSAVQVIGCGPSPARHCGLEIKCSARGDPALEDPSVYSRYQCFDDPLRPRSVYTGHMGNYAHLFTTWNGSAAFPVVFGEAGRGINQPVATSNRPIGARRAMNRSKLSSGNGRLNR